MQQQFLQRFALLFSLLLCLQQAHPYILRSHRLSLADLRNEDQDDDEAQNDSEDEFQTTFETATTDKRSLSGIVTGVIIGSMFVGLGFDIYQHIEGCCQLSAVCAIKREFDTTFKLIKTRSAAIDRSYAEAENRRTYLEYFNTNLQYLWLRVLRLDETQKDLLEALDENIIPKLNIATTNLKIALKSQKVTIGSFRDLEIQFQSVFATAESTLLRMSGFIALGVFKGISVAFKAAKTSVTAQYAAGVPSIHARRYRWLETKWKSVTSAVKNSRVARVFRARGIKLGAKTKAALKGGATVLLGLAVVAMEVWNIVKKVQHCKALERDARSRLATMKETLPLMDKMEKNITIFRYQISRSFQFLKNQVVADSFLQFTKDFVEMARGAANQSKSVQDSVSATINFQNNIKSADYSETGKLVESLGHAFGNVTYKMNCYVKKIQTLNYIYKECSSGNSNFNALFIEAQASYRADSKRCISSGYMTESSARNYIFESLRNKKFQTECVLNNVLKKTLVCTRYILSDYNNQQNALENKLTIAQVQFFLKNCPPIDLDKGRKSEVCRMKWDIKKTLAEVKQLYFKFSPKSVEDTYNNCPKKPCNDLLKKSICNDKSNGQTLAKILATYPTFDEKCMTTTFNTCPLKKLSDPANIEDLKALCGIIQFVPLTMSIYDRYKATYGLAAVVALKNGIGQGGDLCQSFGR